MYQYERPARRRHPLRWTILVVIVLVIVGLLIAADFVARSWAENKTAAEIQQHGFPKKPSVDIEGFPFLTQVAAHKLNDVQISSTNVPEGPLEIASIDASLKDVQINGRFNGGTIDSLNGTAAITFPALASALASEAGSLGALAKSSLTFSAASPNEVKAALHVLVFRGTAVWRVTVSHGDAIHIRLVSAGGLPTSVLSPIADRTLHLSTLPLGLKLRTITVNSSGLVGVLTGQNVSFGS